MRSINNDATGRSWRWEWSRRIPFGFLRRGGGVPPQPRPRAAVFGIYQCNIHLYLRPVNADDGV